MDLFLENTFSARAPKIFLYIYAKFLSEVLLMMNPRYSLL